MEVKDKESLEQFEEDIIEVYGLKPSHGFHRSGKTGKPIPFVLLLSKRAYEDLLSYCSFNSRTWSVPNKIKRSNKSIKREFLRALFDDEGTVIKHSQKRAEVRFYSINHEGISQIQILLKEFNIESRIKEGYGSKRNVYGLIVLNTELFREKVGFNLKRKQLILEEVKQGKEKKSPSPMSPLSRIFVF